MKLATKPLVAVTWDDAHGVAVGDYSDGEIDKDFHKPMRYVTVGLLLRDNESGITLSSDQCYEDNAPSASWRNLAFIPRGMIVDIVNLGIPQKRKTRGTNATRRPGSGAATQSVPARASEVPADHAQGN